MIIIHTFTNWNVETALLPSKQRLSKRAFRKTLGSKNQGNPPPAVKYTGFPQNLGLEKKQFTAAWLSQQPSHAAYFFYRYRNQEMRVGK
uniref:Uncharacterized protein n=1 Tax=Anguilla anguilla TaxID=7936 RepID=A0A0E9X3F0_ANGAN